MFGSEKCPKCNSKVKEKFDFCPYCACDLRDPEKDMKDFGLLGKDNKVEGYPLIGGGSMGFSDKMINSLINGLIKAIDREVNGNVKDDSTHVESFPNGIRIQFGPKPKQTPKREFKNPNSITEEQVKKMSGLPRAEAKTSVRRMSDKVIYELKAPGIESVRDVFVSRLESGYEVKAIGKKKVYINSIPVNLPLRGYKVDNDGLVVEFGLQ